MKKWILTIATMILFNLCFAADTNTHFYPLNPPSNKPEFTSPCLIKISNDSQYDILISGMFDDNSQMPPFIIYAFEQPQFISLYYYNLCHGIMHIGIETTSGIKLYQQETYVNSRIRIKSGWLSPYVILEKSKTPSLK
jgi:hypothetical protein